MGRVIAMRRNRHNTQVMLLAAGDIELCEFDGDTQLVEWVSIVPDPKFILVPRIPATQAKQRFELLR